ncbi:type II CAAX endopeptidase family protein [Mastigocoleus sp. MO_188.B34]|uniref:CPBP family intramembrane glutamic endopeptidase n=1 Tax=Mastigocoleus sp. MO_188.B34 TaxID=3036635 RepID=UPI002613E56A|nr:type II CAAX endopeptidase family protein [Mastigocoleus sp. MO_188.B34]MDJ0694772.1 type II CAAX endopeptidase family protein [Mastigocoleus sp. MO_188.B34]
MTPKRIFLTLLTVIAIVLLGSNLFQSLQRPQSQSLIELYQTDISLQAAAWKPEENADGNLKQLRTALLGTQPVENAIKQYEQVRDSAKKNLERVQNQLTQSSVKSPQTTEIFDGEALELKKITREQQKLIAELDLRLGILKEQQGKTESALEAWNEVPQNTVISPQYSETAKVLIALWEDGSNLQPNTEEFIQKNLEGWFRAVALTQLYQLQKRQDLVLQINSSTQEMAQNALVKLAIIAILPGLGVLIGLGILIFSIAQTLIKGKDSILAQNGNLVWSTPWDGEIILQVFVVGFFFVGQIIVPELLSVLPIPRGAAASVRIQAFYVLTSYLLVAFGALSVLYFSIKNFFPLAEDWFRFRFRDKWILWGFGGYCAALPIVLLVSVINQKLWEGQGGSNPLLQLVLKSQDSVALTIFFFTAAIAAPLFEEILFRGFLLPSLTRYLPVWGSIIISSVLFAAAHFSLSELLPLTSLGIILGIVYTRSRNLLAPMLLHSLWNSGTLLSLFIVGSSSS